MEFKNKDNQLSNYSFMCGYIQDIWKDNVKVELYHEGCCYHVRAYDYNNYNRLLWDSFESLLEARKEFFKQVKKIHSYSKKEAIKYIK